MSIGLCFAFYYLKSNLSLAIYSIKQFSPCVDAPDYSSKPVAEWQKLTIEPPFQNTSLKVPIHDFNHS